MRLCIVQPAINVASETFFKAQAERLPFEVCVVHYNGGLWPHVGNTPILSQSLLHRGFRKARRSIFRQPWDRTLTEAHIAAFRRFRAEAVLAQYGTTGVGVMDACTECEVPLVVHFHGFDASMHAVIAEHSERYRRMFGLSSAIVAGCESMKRRLIAIGAPAGKVHVNYVSTVDTSDFYPHDPASCPPRFVAVGRFVEKKAPHITLLAFAKVNEQVPDVTLVFVGDGPLLNACKDLARALKVENCVTFLGSQPPEIVQHELSQSRCFVQHSVKAANGDSEGTSISVLEASASGLPVVATRHEGIAETMIDGETGFLVDEFDVDGMANAMLRLIEDPALCSRVGTAGRLRVESRFSMDHSISGLCSILEAAAGHRSVEVEARQPVAPPAMLAAK